jgi:PKD repeat protein
METKGKKISTIVSIAIVLLVVFVIFPVIPVNAQVGVITYNATSNTISVANYTAFAPASFTSLWQADQVGHWNVIQKQSNNQFVISCKIRLESGCFLNDTDKQITFAANISTANGQYLIGGPGIITLGSVVNAVSKTTSNGVSFYTPGQGFWYYWIWTGGEYLYSSSFDAGGLNEALVYATNLWNCMAAGRGFAGFHAESQSSFFNIVCSNTYFGIYFDTPSINAKYDRISLLSVEYGIRNFGNGDGATISNIYARNCSYLFVNEGLTIPITQYLVNVDADKWTFSWVSPDKAFPQTNASAIYRQYTFELTVTAPDGTAIPNAAVSITDSKGTQVLAALTDSAGQTPTTALSLGFYDNSGGTAIHPLAPYSLKITAAGYTDYTTSIPATQKTDWHISLQPITVPKTWIISRFTYFCPNLNTRTVLFDGSFSNTSSEISSYFWDFGDGNTSIGVSLDHTYIAPGPYTVTLTVSNNEGQDTYSQTINLSVPAIFPWWWALIALLIILLLLLLLILLLWNRRNVVVVQAYVQAQEICKDSDICDNCEIKPC